MNETRDLEAWDPHYDTLEKGEVYDIMGFINASIEIVSITHKGLMLYKVPLRLGTNGFYNQAIIEIWVSNKIEEPIFTPDWTRCQLAYIRDAKFVDFRKTHGLEFYQFVLPRNPSSRFIWLTDHSRDFWAFPVSEPEDIRRYAFREIESNDTTLCRGYVRCSEGSVFGKAHSSQSCLIHTSTKIGGDTFIKWYNEVIDFKQFLLDQGEKLMERYQFNMPQECFEGHLKMHFIQKKYGLSPLLDLRQKLSFWDAFEQTKFDEDESQDQVNPEQASSNISDVCEKDDQDVTNIENNSAVCEKEYSEDEIEDDDTVGEHIGYDGESDRSEDEEMNEEDRLFLDDETKENEPGPSSLALLNANRFASDDAVLRRLFRAPGECVDKRSAKHETSPRGNSKKKRKL